ncbi:hypothetical protein TSUD_294080 [Trifolium subterraneum]|uniref:NAD(P)H dehydrogenase (quinone) n=1 Tax=Trifolium subterraneum TaxID=3900 RepID=A0A2Z6MMH7_TRISU|nr:hypothetical protein TSUD_294080 [Trifolium subterraneum]
MEAPPKSDVPIITPTDVTEADGLLFGFPTRFGSTKRFGMMTSQFKSFLNATGGLWRTQALAGKPVGIFYSTGSQGGGQETTPLTSIIQLGHHGLIFLPIDYTFGDGMFETENVKGGSLYGAETYVGDGSRQLTELELAQAFHQGKYFAGIANKLKGTPYGARTYAGDGSRQPTELKLAQAFHQGKYFAGIANKHKGSQ